MSKAIIALIVILAISVRATPSTSWNGNWIVASTDALCCVIDELVTKLNSDSTKLTSTYYYNANTCKDIGLNGATKVLEMTFTDDNTATGSMQHGDLESVHTTEVVGNKITITTSSGCIYVGTSGSSSLFLSIGSLILILILMFHL